MSITSASPGDKFVPQMKASHDRRSTDDTNEHYTDAHWHPSKSVSIANIIGFISILLVGYIAYDDTIDKLTLASETATRELAVLENGYNLQIDALRSNMEEATKDRIHASTVLEMFRTRDIQIKNLADKMSAMEARQEETNRLLTSIYREMPKKIKNEN